MTPRGRVERRGAIKRAAGVWGRRRTMFVGDEEEATLAIA